MMINKLVGFVLIVFATGSYGICLGRELKIRLETLKAVKNAFVLLKGEIRLNHETLPDALKNISQKVSHAGVADFAASVANRLCGHEGEGLTKIWEEESIIFSSGSYLEKKDCDKLIMAGEGLGFLDLRQQIDNIDLYVEVLDLDIKDLQDNYKSLSKIYTSLGFVSGLLIAIILV